MKVVHFCIKSIWVSLALILAERWQNSFARIYLPSMGGSFSIKRVLPSLFPDDPALDYHNLEGGVQNGSDAMNIFPKIQYMEAKEQETARKALLQYCCLDTFAMVKVWEKQNEVTI